VPANKIAKLTKLIKTRCVTNVGLMYKEDGEYDLAYKMYMKGWSEAEGESINVLWHNMLVLLYTDAWRTKQYRIDAAVKWLKTVPISQLSSLPTPNHDEFWEKVTAKMGLMKIATGPPIEQVNDRRDATTNIKAQHKAAAQNTTLKCYNCERFFSSLKVCSNCKTVRYCSRECQSSHWKIHKPMCKKPESSQ